MNNKIVIYETPNKEIRIDVRLENETVWLTQSQISVLFETERSVITKHLRNIFKSNELEEKWNVQKMHITNSDKPIKSYSLDAIISTGYRVNSTRATQFRIWATNILKNFLISGYALNEKRLSEVQNKFKELQTTISFMEEKSKRKLLTGQEGELLHLLSSYAKALTLLEAYDNGKITETKGKTTTFLLTYKNCLQIITEIKKVLISKEETGDLFGNERGNSFEGIIKGLYQTYDAAELYPNIGDKAANLLYLIIKDHPFSDGNKRTAAFLFVYFLDKTNSLYRETGEKRINDNALTALALLIAESDPNEKDIMIKIIKNLITD